MPGGTGLDSRRGLATKGVLVKKLIGLAALCAALLAVPGAGARESYPTEMSLIHSTPDSGDRVLWSGVLNSDKARCERNRRVELAVDEGAGFVLQDTTLSSRAGAWGLRGEESSGDIRIKVFAKDVGDDRCQGSSLTMTRR
jgi:hypothetical protein